MIFLNPNPQVKKLLCGNFNNGNIFSLGGIIHSTGSLDKNALCILFMKRLYGNTASFTNIKIIPTPFIQNTMPKNI